MECLVSHLDLASTMEQLELIVARFIAFRTSREVGKWPSVCDTGVGTHIMDDWDDTTHPSDAALDLVQ